MTKPTTTATSNHTNKQPFILKGRSNVLFNLLLYIFKFRCVFINRSFELSEFKSTIRIEEVLFSSKRYIGMNEWCNNLLVNLYNMILPKRVFIMLTRTLKNQKSNQDYTVSASAKPPPRCGWGAVF